MHAGEPGAACSKEFSSGVISSQPARRPCTRGAACEKSGTRNGLASWADSTDCGSTFRSGRTPVATGPLGASGSGSGSMPAAACISRSSRRVLSEISASSASRWKSDGSRAAVCARIVATPSRRLSWVSRCCSVSESSARTRVRSARASRATAW